MKSSEEMTIGELADRFGLPTHVLRHWESTGVLTPARRVNGRRRYHETHITRISLVMRGKDAGFSLAEIRDLLDAPDIASRRSILRRQRVELEAQIDRLNHSLQMIEHALQCRAKDFTQCVEFRRLVRHAEISPGV